MILQIGSISAKIIHPFSKFTFIYLFILTRGYVFIDLGWEGGRKCDRSISWLNIKDIVWFWDRLFLNSHLPACSVGIIATNHSVSSSCSIIMDAQTFIYRLEKEGGRKVRRRGGREVKRRGGKKETEFEIPKVQAFKNPNLSYLLLARIAIILIHSNLAMCIQVIKIFCICDTQISLLNFKNN